MRQTIALVLSIGLGLVAVFAMKMYIDREKSSARSDQTTVAVLKVNKRLPAGSLLNREDIAAAQLPAESVTSDMITPAEQDMWIGRPLSIGLDLDGLVFKSFFRQPEAKVSSEIPKGFRLATLAVDQISGVAGLVQAKGRVDLLYTQLEKRAKEAAASQKTVLLLSNVQVYAVDDRTAQFTGGTAARAGQRAYTSVTLVLTPQEAVLVTAAQSMGRVSLALRGPDDPGGAEKVPAVTPDNLEAEAAGANKARQAK